jgi:signal transduction histidine kinase
MSIAVVGAIADLYAAAALQRHAAYREHLGRAAAEQQRQNAEDHFAETLHEVRSTVVALEGGVRCLAPGEDPVASTALARALTGEVERLRALVSNESCDAHAGYVVLDALEPMLMVSRMGGWPVSWEIPGSLAVDGRAADLAQIVQGFLTNAIRYAPGAPVDVQAQRDGAFVLVRVTDRGPGVPRGERELIFLRGVRGRAADDDGGRGLGLYLARNLAQSQGGDVWVEQSPGGGASFVVALPATGASELESAPSEAKPTGVVRALTRPSPRARSRRAHEKAPS